MCQWVVSTGSDNGLSPILRQAIIWTNSVSLSIGPLGKKLQWNFNQNTGLFIHENALKTIVCEMAAILSWGRWVKHRNTLHCLDQYMTPNSKYTRGECPPTSHKWRWETPPLKNMLVCYTSQLAPRILTCVWLWHVNPTFKHSYKHIFKKQGNPCLFHWPQTVPCSPTWDGKQFRNVLSNFDDQYIEPNSKYIGVECPSRPINWGESSLKCRWVPPPLKKTNYPLKELEWVKDGLCIYSGKTGH